MPRQRKGDRVVGVYSHAKGYEIKYVQDGKSRSHYRKAKKAADAHAAQLAAKIAGDDPPKDASNGAKAKPGRRAASSSPRAVAGAKPADWLSILWDLAQRVAADTSDEEAQRALRAISSAASAAKNYVDLSEIAEELARHNKWFIDITKAREQGFSE
jgi:hypothetical protein